MCQTPQKPRALDYASPDLARLKCVRTIAWFSALAMYVGFILAAVFTAFGPRKLALCLWAYACVVTVVFVIACVMIRRAQAGNDDDDAPPDESTAGYPPPPRKCVAGPAPAGVGCSAPPASGSSCQR